MHTKQAFEDAYYAWLETREEKYYAIIYGYCYPSFRGKAQNFLRGTERNEIELIEDILQDFFIYVLSNPDSFMNADKPEGYLFWSFRNFFITYLKRLAVRNKRIRLAGLYEERSARTTDQWLEGLELERAIGDARRLLTPQQWTVFALSRLEGLGTDQIAERLQITPNTVYNHMTEALKKVRSHLGRWWLD